MINLFKKNKPEPKISKKEFFENYVAEKGKYQINASTFIQIAPPESSVEDAWKLYKKYYPKFDENFMLFDKLKNSAVGGWY